MQKGMKCFLAAAALALLCLLAACDGEEKPRPTFPFSPGEFLTNLRDDEKKVLKSEITLELSEKKYVKEFEGKLHVVRDTITRVLRELSQEDIGKDDVMTALESKLIEQLNEAMGYDTVARAYFSTFVTAST